MVLFSSFLWNSVEKYGILFSGMKLYQEGIPLSKASVQNYREKEVIFAEGKSDAYLYKIMSGQVAFFLDYGTPEEQLVGVSAPPNFFGTMNVFTGRPCGYTAVALTDTTLMRVPNAALDSFVRTNSATTIVGMKSVVDHLATVNEAVGLMMEELKAFCRGEKFGKRDLQDLVDRYGTILGSRVILDQYEEYTPAPVEELPPEPATTMEQDVASFYMEGHRGYPGIVHPEYKKYLIQTEYTCPHCQNKFKADKILTSKLIPVRDMAEEMRYDLRVYYRDFEAEWYEIVTCPHCYFSSFENYFRDTNSLYRSRYETKLAHLCDSIALDFTKERDLDFVFAQHYLALACARGISDRRQIEARIWMNLIRLYKDAGEEELSKAAEQKTVDAYQTVYMECELQPGQEQRLCLTVAGMLFAQGEKKAAREWAAKVRRGSGDRSAYWNMAEQLIQDVRAEMSEGN